MDQRFSSTLSFIDVLFNVLISLSALFLLVILIINPIKTDETARPDQAPYIVTIRWQDYSNHDVDLWMTDGKDICMFANRQTNGMSLDRDDLGPDNTATMEHFIKENEEFMSVRTLKPATYTAAVHYYRQRSETIEKPVVKWALIKMSPTKQVVASGTAFLESQGQEITLIRFQIGSDGQIVLKDTVSQYPFVHKR